MKERRRHKRYARHLDVKYTCAKGPLIIEGSTKSKDISDDGMRVSVDDALKTADRVLLEITLPWRQNPVSAIGKVAWSASRLIENVSGAERDSGLEFTWNPNKKELASLGT